MFCRVTEEMSRIFNEGPAASSPLKVIPRRFSIGAAAAAAAEREAFHVFQMLFSSRGNNRPILIVEWRRVLSAEAQKKGSCALDRMTKNICHEIPHLTLRALIFPPRSHQKITKLGTIH